MSKVLIVGAPAGSDLTSLKRALIHVSTGLAIWIKLNESIKFKSLKLGDPDVGDYYTGRESSFVIRNGCTGKQMPGAPIMKTPQWRRGI